MKVKTPTISAFVRHISPVDRHVLLQNCSLMQVVPSMKAVPHCDRIQGAAIVIDQALLVVWHDSPDRLLPRAASMEDKLLGATWRPRGIIGAEKDEGSVV